VAVEIVVSVVVVVLTLGFGTYNIVLGLQNCVLHMNSSNLPAGLVEIVVESVVVLVVVLIVEIVVFFDTLNIVTGLQNYVHHMLNSSNLLEVLVDVVSVVVVALVVAFVVVLVVPVVVLILGVGTVNIVLDLQNCVHHMMSSSNLPVVVASVAEVVELFFVELGASVVAEVGLSVMEQIVVPPAV